MSIQDKIKELDKNGEVLEVMHDPVFKSLFQSKEGFDILAYIISEILNLNINYVKRNLTFKNTELPKEGVIERGKTADLVVDIKGTIVNLECNYTSGDIFRNMIYHHKLASEAHYVSELPNESTKVIQINFDNINKYDDRLIIPFMMIDDTGKYKLSESFINYHINLSKMDEVWYNSNKERINKFERILLMMVLNKKKLLREIALGDKELETMEKKIEELSHSENIIGLYDKEEYDKIARDYDIAEAKGEGLKEGREEGKKEGLEQRNIEIAKNMLEDGIKPETIAKYTNLSIEEISKLK